MALLDVQQLSIAFRQYTSTFNQTIVPVVQNLHLQVDAGEIVAIVGASGAGKSLLAHAIMGLLPHNAIVDGTIKYAGQLCNEALWQQLRGKALRFVPQSTTYLNPLLTVEQQLTKEQVKQADFELASFGKRYPFQLSGGMMRKVFLATVTTPPPQLLIADELTPGLDQAAVEIALERLKKLADQGAAILLITHHLEAAAAIADRMVVLHEGKMVETVRGRDFLADGAQLYHAYTKKLWQSLPSNLLRQEPQAYETNREERPSGKPLVEVRQLDYYYRKKQPVLQNVHLAFKQGEVVGISGVSGSGKSTLAKLLAGHLPIQTGAITIDHPIKCHYPIQLILQHPEKAFNPQLKLRDSLAESWLPDRQLLQKLEIADDWLDRWPHELSGGQLQRINIARALHPETIILIADEMTAMLDVITQAQLWKQVLAIAKERKMTLLVISHDQPLLKLVCSRIVTIEQLQL